MRSNEPYAKGFGRRLRQARVELDFTQRELGEAVGISNFTISEIERGQTIRLPLALLAGLVRLCRERGISLRWLIMGDGPIGESA